MGWKASWYRRALMPTLPALLARYPIAGQLSTYAYLSLREGQA